MPYKDLEKEKVRQRLRIRSLEKPRRILTIEQRAAKTKAQNKWRAAQRKLLWSHRRADGSARIKAPRPCPEICEVCGSPPSTGRRLDFDHCHERNVFRGWLCNPCNMALGCAKDDPERLRKLAQYLEDFALFT